LLELNYFIYLTQVDRFLPSPFRRGGGGRGIQLCKIKSLSIPNTRDKFFNNFYNTIIKILKQIFA